MFLETVDALASTTAAKAAFVKRRPGGLFVSFLGEAAE